jgi:hypothetical protein
MPSGVPIDGGQRHLDDAADDGVQQPAMVEPGGRVTSVKTEQAHAGEATFAEQRHQDRSPAAAARQRRCGKGQQVRTMTSARRLRQRRRHIGHPWSGCRPE